MLKTLLPVDGSPVSLRAAQHAIRLAQHCEPTEILLINIQPPADSPELRSHLPVAEIEAMQETRGGDALASARALLDAAGVAYVAEVRIGPVAEAIVACAVESGCDKIVMGSKGENLLMEVIIGSVAHEVLRRSHIPVTFVR
ncbi:MAG: universal stress protein [Gammaproteobacteria bacterium]|nr:universal stress protein [Gammaproteobacteria bacterium]MBU1655816.1 universal stress protein [Gammaproteobacteria bacterium]MBU1962396.1 universal stress protein [Gammaproteobacteria bacterium]